ncbi:MAG: tyrosinase family protein, partial [Jiangellaceae bacterium]
MARTRVDVWNATDDEGDWPVVLQAYERAIGTMRSLDDPDEPPADPLGWRFQAAIHGLADENGDPDTGNPFWCNCQHGSWFFLPWHRMYLAAFEKIIQ